jgi:hypothetical protein
MKCRVEIGSGGMIYVPNFIQTGLGGPQLIGVDTHADTDWK